MIVIEFYLKTGVPEQDFNKLCQTAYSLGSNIRRKIDDQNAPPIFGVSKNTKTRWVQLLIDDNTPATTLSAIKAAVNLLKTSKPSREYSSEKDNVAPPEESW